MSRKLVNRLLLVCLSLGSSFALATPALAQRNLLQNGSFEANVLDSGRWRFFNANDPSQEIIPGWKQTPGEGSGTIELQNNAAGAPADGDVLLELDSNGVTSIFQDFPTSPGQTYRLRFSFSARPGIQDNRLRIRWDYRTVEFARDGEGRGETEWEEYTVYLVARGSSSRIIFDNLAEVSNGLGTYIDNVSVVNVPSLCPDNNWVQNNGFAASDVPLVRQTVDSEIPDWQLFAGQNSELHGNSAMGFAADERVRAMNITGCTPLQ